MLTYIFSSDKEEINNSNNNKLKNDEFNNSNNKGGYNNLAIVSAISFCIIGLGGIIYKIYRNEESQEKIEVKKELNVPKELSKEEKKLILLDYNLKKLDIIREISENASFKNSESYKLPVAIMDKILKNIKEIYVSSAEKYGFHYNVVNIMNNPKFNNLQDMILKSNEDYVKEFKEKFNKLEEEYVKNYRDFPIILRDFKNNALNDIYKNLELSNNEKRLVILDYHIDILDTIHKDDSKKKILEGLKGKYSTVNANEIARLEKEGGFNLENISKIMGNILKNENIEILNKKYSKYFNETNNILEEFKKGKLDCGNKPDPVIPPVIKKSIGEIHSELIIVNSSIEKFKNDINNFKESALNLFDGSNTKSYNEKTLHRDRLAALKDKNILGTSTDASIQKEIDNLNSRITALEQEAIDVEKMQIKTFANIAEISNKNQELQEKISQLHIDILECYKGNINYHTNSLSTTKITESKAKLNTFLKDTVGIPDVITICEKQIDDINLTVDNVYDTIFTNYSSKYNIELTNNKAVIKGLIHNCMVILSTISSNTQEVKDIESKIKFIKDSQYENTYNYREINSNKVKQKELTKKQMEYILKINDYNQPGYNYTHDVIEENNIKFQVSTTLFNAKTIDIPQKINNLTLSSLYNTVYTKNEEKYRPIINDLRVQLSNANTGIELFNICEKLFVDMVELYGNNIALFNSHTYDIYNNFLSNGLFIIK